MALQGDVDTMPVRELLGWLAARRATGTLTLSRGMKVCTFDLDAGMVTLASSSEENALIGKLLVAEGLVDARELEAVLASKKRRGKVRLGVALERAGLVQREDLARVLVQKVRLLLEDALGWEDGRFAFHEGEPARSRPSLEARIDLGRMLDTLPPPLVVEERDVIDARDA